MRRTALIQDRYNVLLVVHSEEYISNEEYANALTDQGNKVHKVWSQDVSPKRIGQWIKNHRKELER